MIDSGIANASYAGELRGRGYLCRQGTCAGKVPVPDDLDMAVYGDKCIGPPGRRVRHLRLLACHSIDAEEAHHSHATFDS